MNRGFYYILAAQFFSALADHALLVAAISLLFQLGAPEWQTPWLKIFFVISYVVLAPFVGAFADALPKGKVMFISNSIKIFGCLSMLLGMDPFYAYAIVGFGAAAYSPAKYGILTEYLPPSKLVIANGWMEGLTVGAIITGTVVGGLLINKQVATTLLSITEIPGVESGIDTAPEMAISIIVGFYIIASIFNLYIPKLAIDHKPLKKNPLFIIHDFWHCFKLLWKDKLGQVSLAVTTLFWGAGATLQFIVIKWADTSLGFGLDKASYLQGVVALGIAIGAGLAAKYVSLDRAVKVIPLGIAMGFAVMLMNLIFSWQIAAPLLVLIGALGGFFVVPMNALLQHRGHLLMGAGHSIAVQNFNENISILVMSGLYSMMIGAKLSIYYIVIIFGAFLAGTMMLILWRLRQIQQQQA
ncbi:MAG: lysophospholipid transporter LplT [Pseudomonadota bacterium]|jgi:MFS transporter, LPLT family, lysophospholipid transporter